MKIKTLTTFVLIALAVSCRGEVSDKPPIHLVPNMDFQDKFKAQSSTEFEGWHGRAMRLPAHGTIASLAPRATTKAAVDAAFAERAKYRVYFNGMTGDKKNYIADNPLAKTAAVLARGKERYEIHCAICHGLTGRGDGYVGHKLSIRPPSFHEKGNPQGAMIKPAVPGYPDAQLFDVITTGGGTTMRPYADQVSPKDRWAIIHYIRALQLRAKN